MLRLVEPPPLADRALRNGTEPPPETPPLRLVDRGGPERGNRAPERLDLPPARRAAEPPIEHRTPPVSDEGDGDLLIFAQARSAWFVGHGEEADLDWSTTADSGWQAAEQAARPAVGAETNAGLPKRVPQANLVPGSPLREERPLRIVRDAASLAENTTGYFRGWRRGQEIGGFAVGGRPGRRPPAAGTSPGTPAIATTIGSTSTAPPATAPDLRTTSAGAVPSTPSGGSAPPFTCVFMPTPG
ncbi:hypothetical protein GCM10029963_38720 [Micromonospora andamanensis]